MPKRKEVSLLPSEENPESLGNKVLQWVTTVGRFIIVFTELIVVSAFLSRFWLDRQNSDLSEKIRQQTAILQTTVPFENEFNLLQQRINLIKNLRKANPALEQKISSLSQSTPPDVIFTNLTINNDDKNVVTAKLSVSSPKQESIVDFVNNLSLNPLIKSLNIQKIEKKPKSSTYQLDLDITFTS